MFFENSVIEHKYFNFILFDNFKIGSETLYIYMVNFKNLNNMKNRIFNAIVEKEGSVWQAHSTSSSSPSSHIVLLRTNEHRRV